MTRGSKTSTESNVAQKYAVQSGIALGPILFILAIVAIIAAAIAVGSSGFKGNLGNDAASVLASSLMQQADTIYEATQQVFIGNSCPITQINFANPILPDYTNTSAPADHSCDVFNGTSGGGANYPIPNAKWLDPSMSAQTGYGQWLMTSSTCIPYIGSAPQVCYTSASDYPIVLILPYVQQSVCKVVAQRVSTSCSTTTTSSNEYGFYPFTGSFTAAGVRLEVWESVQPGSPCLLEGCAYQPLSGLTPVQGVYSYYKVLVAQ